MGSGWENDAWIGVDLDGTLAEYDKFRGLDHIGKPIPAMVERVKKWLRTGRRVKIMTARVSHYVVDPDPGSIGLDRVARKAIDEFCEEQFGQLLEVTCIKDFKMIELWDDRVVQVVPNTGDQIGPSRLIE